MRHFLHYKLVKATTWLALVTLMVNASLAYSACCDFMVEQPVMSDGMEMPCHVPSEQSDSSVNMDECCVSVMPVISLKNDQTTPFLPASHALVAADSGAIFRELDSHFKPPISFLL